MYIYMCVSVDWPMSVLFVYICVYVCVFVCDIKSKYHQKNKKNVSGLSKIDALLHKTHQIPPGSEVPRLNMCRSIIVSKIIHQMSCNHPFSQKKQDNKKSSGGGSWR